MKKNNNLCFIVVSDSHGAVDRVKYIYNNCLTNCDGVIFLGDGLNDFYPYEEYAAKAPLYCVKGNCDLFFSAAFSDGSDIPYEMLLNLGGYRVLLTHGHKFDVKNGFQTMMSYAVQKGADVVLFGHTHERFEAALPPLETQNHENNKSIMLFNPGSLRGSYASYGSFGTMTITEKGIIFGYGELR